SANLNHQADADRRDQAFDNQPIDQPVDQGQVDPLLSVSIIDRPQILKRRPDQAPRTYSSEYWDRVEPQRPPVRQPKQSANLTLPPVDIAAIGVAGYRRNLQDDQAIAFSTSLYEIDHLIEKQLADQEDDQQVQERLPEAYKDLADVFSKAASDTLPPQRPLRMSYGL
ncbi:hypothetical protein V501_00381, partial [Pseudogymnoascus sp. VKM F-4519 (FW-2642)]